MIILLVRIKRKQIKLVIYTIIVVVWVGIIHRLSPSKVLKHQMGMHHCCQSNHRYRHDVCVISSSIRIKIILLRGVRGNASYMSSTPSLSSSESVSSDTPSPSVSVGCLRCCRYCHCWRNPIHHPLRHPLVILLFILLFILTLTGVIIVRWIHSQRYRPL